MEGIKTFTKIICSASVCSAFIVFLIPEGNMKKTVNFAVSLFLMSVMVMPVFGKDTFNFEIPDISAYEFSDNSAFLYEYNDFITENSKKVIEREVCSVLEDICKDSFLAEVVMDNKENHEIVLEKIIIIIGKNDIGNTAIIKNKIFNLTGLIPEVVNEY